MISIDEYLTTRSDLHLFGTRQAAFLEKNVYEDIGNKWPKPEYAGCARA
jgi:hypothetical protein